MRMRRVTTPKSPCVRSGGSTMHDLEALRHQATDGAGCLRCPLARTRQTVVFGEGPVDARVMVVAEGPGANEDKWGRPLIGRAGQRLDWLLADAGLERSSLYLTNMVKCRPLSGDGRNRQPTPVEMDACNVWLAGQARAIGPRVVVALGLVAGQRLLRPYRPELCVPGVRMADIRREVYRMRSAWLVVTYHPAAVERNGALHMTVVMDLRRVHGLLAH